jgi:hypothetical protein
MAWLTCSGVSGACWVMPRRESRDGASPVGTVAVGRKSLTEGKEWLEGLDAVLLVATSNVPRCWQSEEAAADMWAVFRQFDQEVVGLAGRASRITRDVSRSEGGGCRVFSCGVGG